MAGVQMQSTVDEVWCADKERAVIRLESERGDRQHTCVFTAVTDVIQGLKTRSTHAY